MLNILKFVPQTLCPILRLAYYLKLYSEFITLQSIAIVVHRHSIKEHCKYNMLYIVFILYASYIYYSA